MALNALESEMVTFTGVPGIEANGITVGYRAEYTPRTSTEIKYQAIEQRTSDVSGGNNLNRGQYYIQLGEQLYDGKLTKRYARDDFERPSINWQYNGKDVGTYVDYELLVVNGTYTDKVTGEALYDLLTYTTIDQNDLLVYTDGVANNTQKTELRRSNKNAVGGSGKGVLTEVFLDEERDEIIVTSINTYLAKANSDYNTTNETLSLRVYTGSSSAGVTTTTKIVDSDEVPQAEGVAKDDFKLVYMSGKESATTIGNYVNYDVVKIFDTEIMSAAEITKFSTNDTKVVGKLTTGGTEYDTNVKAFYDYGEVLDQYDNQLLSDTTYNIYLDRYGNVIGVDLNEGNLNYVFITGYDRGRSNISVKTADAAAIFTDGTMDTIVVNVTDTNKNIRGAKASAKDPYAYMEYGEWNADGNNANTQGDRNLNRWYTYTQSASGVYTLKPVKNFMFTSYNIAANGSKVLDSANLYLDDSSVINGTVTPTANKGRVYGEDESIYITVGEGLVDTGNGTDAITDVDGVYTGAQDIKIELTAGSKGTVNNDKTATNKAENAQESLAEQSAYVYTVFDNNNYIIASVVLGEAQGATANYVYVMGDAKNERVERASSSRANDSDTYYWEFDAVVDGVKTTLTVKEKYSTTLQNLLNVHGLVQVRYDGEYVVDIDPVDTTDIYYTYDNGTDGGENTPSGQIEDKDVYDVGNVNGSAWVDDKNGEIQNTLGLRGTNNAFVPERNDIDRVNGTIYLQGRTLYVMNAAGQRDVGLALARDAKAVLIQPEDGEEEATDCTDVQNAIDRLVDRDTRDVSAAAGIQFKGRIVAVLDNRGVAQWVVIISDTNLATGNDPNYGSGSGNLGTKLNGSRGDVTYTIANNGIMHATVTYTAPAYAVKSAAGVTGSVVTMPQIDVYDGSVFFDRITLTPVGSGVVGSDGKVTFTYRSNRYDYENVSGAGLSFRLVGSESLDKVQVRYVDANNRALSGVVAAVAGLTDSLATTGNNAINFKLNDRVYNSGVNGTYTVTGVTQSNVTGTATPGNDVTINTVTATGTDYVTVKVTGLSAAATVYDITAAAAVPDLFTTGGGLNKFGDVDAKDNTLKLILAVKGTATGITPGDSRGMTAKLSNPVAGDSANVTYKVSVKIDGVEYSAKLSGTTPVTLTNASGSAYFNVDKNIEIAAADVVVTPIAKIKVTGATWKNDQMTITFSAPINPDPTGESFKVANYTLTGTTAGSAAVAAVYTITLTGSEDSANLGTKKVVLDKDFVITWDTDLATTMGNLVSAINTTGAGSSTFSATYSNNVLTLTAKVAGTVGGSTAGVPANAPTNDAGLTVANPTVGADAVAAGTPGSPANAKNVSLAGDKSVTVTFTTPIKEGDVVTVAGSKGENAEDSTNKVAGTTITITDGKAVIAPAP